MSLTKCGECGKDVSDSAGKCPHCGAKVKKPVGIVGWIIGAIMLVFMVKCTVGTENAKEQAAAIEKSITPEQRAEKDAREARFQKTAIAAAGLKKLMREPESVKWETIISNRDASTICMSYRARNGFGGMNQEIAVIANGMTSQKNSAWNKHCTGDGMFDMKSVIHALK